MEMLLGAVKELPGWAQVVIIGLVGTVLQLWRSLVQMSRNYVKLSERVVSMIGSTRGPDQRG